MTGTHDESRSAGTLSIAGLVVGPALFVTLRFLPAPEGLGADGWAAAAVVILMAVWWFTQAIPLGATALLPALLFPVLGVAPLEKATAPYAHPLIFLFLGGFVLALTVERWNLHRRLAVLVIGVAGSGPGRLVAGFMVATAFLSMWVSNTATTLMMVPIATSVIAFVGAGAAPGGALPAAGDAGRARFARCLLLAVAYSASIGGLATLIGTPPNAFLAGYMSQRYGVEIGFGRWMLVGLPLTLVLLCFAWILLTRLLFPVAGLDLGRVRAGLAAERRALGPMGRGERMAALLFGATALLWTVQPLVARIVPIGDTGIALLAAVAAFALPVSLKERTFLTDWRHAVRLPWEILLLFGGGLSLAAAIDATGLARWLGGLLGEAGALSPVFLLLLATALVVFLTELASNTATAAVFVPVAATLAGAAGLDPLPLAAAVALAASCAFMMPVATPPNAIVFSGGQLAVVDMCRSGFLLNVAAILLIAVVSWSLVPLVFSAH
jgi:sodium-dependent dicarboxylate transporter 2/3/5